MKNLTALVFMGLLSFSSHAFSTHTKDWKGRVPAQSYDAEIETARAAEDKTLNETWQKIMASTKISKEHKAALKAAQVFWISYREKECVFEAAYFAGGNMYTTALKGCELELTMKRVAELKQILNFQP